jgi:hypothetical protein
LELLDRAILADRHYFDPSLAVESIAHPSLTFSGVLYAVHQFLLDRTLGPSLGARRGCRSLMTALRIFILLFFWISAVPAFGQAADDKDTHAINAFYGKMLPFGVYGVRDTYPFWGARYSHQIWGIDPEYSAYFVNSGNVNFYTGSASIAFPEELDKGISYRPFLGGDFHYYSGHTVSKKLPFTQTFGFHLGCSPIVEITPKLALRVDFKFNFGPGLVLDVGTGLSTSF